MGFGVLRVGSMLRAVLLRSTADRVRTTVDHLKLVWLVTHRPSPITSIQLFCRVLEPIWDSRCRVSVREGHGLFSHSSFIKMSSDSKLCSIKIMRLALRSRDVNIVRNVHPHESRLCSSSVHCLRASTSRLNYW